MRVFLSLSLVIFVQATMIAQSPTPQECAASSGEVLVTVKPDPANERGSIIRIKNNSKDAIVAFSVGEGATPELYASEFGVPLKIAGPSGWTATHVFNEESSFMRWVWTARSPDHVIAANESNSNFKIALPQFPPSAQKNVYPDGTPVRPIVISELPFRIQFSNGRCVWGRIQSE